jgi:cytochrome P450
VQIATHVLRVQRSPKYFTNPLDFVPEQWIDSLRDPSWNHDTRAWMPFQTGAYACAGKQLALNELRLLTAKVVKQFDITMPDDFDDEGFRGSIQSFQSLMMGPLLLLVKSSVRPES